MLSHYSYDFENGVGEYKQLKYYRLKVKIDNRGCGKYLFINNHLFRDMNVFYKFIYTYYAGSSSTHFQILRNH